MQGRAIDVRLHALLLREPARPRPGGGKGGVGYYHRSDFVHLDTGRFRTWAG